MKSMPHHPDYESFRCMRHAAQLYLEEHEPQRESEFLRGNGEGFRMLGDQRLVQGMIGYLYDMPLPEVAHHLRKGLADIRIAFELKAALHAWQVWDYFLYAAAVNDRPLAHSLASMPEDVWWNREIKPVPWLIRQVKAAFAIYRKEETVASRHLHDLHVLTFKEELPPELQPNLPEIRNYYRLLESILKKDSVVFNKSLEERTEIRADSFRRGGTIAPIALLDLHGLGLSRMARDRGISVTIQHVYLPLELLDA